MKKLYYILFCFIFIGGIVMGMTENTNEGLFASFNINNQLIKVELFYQEVPLTVTSFVGLATGKFDGHVSRKGKYFDGLTFHRVVDGFVIQGGDPVGNGTGGPGYAFPDEFDKKLLHSDSGVLSMANAGPGTNGSQFFITLAPTPHLNGRHSVFGKVIEGKELIFRVKQGDKITSLVVEAKGNDAQTFLNNISWDGFQSMLSGHEQESKKDIQEQIDAVLNELQRNNDFKKTDSNLYYQLLEEGSGNKAQSGDNAIVHYSLQLYGQDGIIDSSYSRNSPFSVLLGANSVIKGWELMLLEMKKGDKVRVIIPPELAYGERGAGGVIPPHAFLDFTIEMIDIQ